MKIITVEFIMRNGPCESYTEDRVKELIGKGKTPLEILYLKIPATDRLWVLTRHKVLSKKILGEFALRVAERVLPVFEKQFPDDGRPRAALVAARKYLRGETTKEKLKIAAAAAAAAAVSVSASASAGYAAAQAAAAAVAAAYAAYANYAYYTSAQAALAADADPEQREREKQVADLKELLKGEEAQGETK